MVTVTISTSLIQHVRALFSDGIRGLARGNVLVQEDRRNGYSDLALPAYIIAVAAVEALTNEVFLSGMARGPLEGAALFELKDEWVERLELRAKMVIIAKLLCATTLRRGSQPFQDFSTLVDVRNEIVHYKMREKTPPFVKDLNQKKIGLVTKPPEAFGGQSGMPWVLEISTTEGIRWAYNTAADMMRHLSEMIPQCEEEYEERRLQTEGHYKAFEFLRAAAQGILNNLPRIDDKMRDQEWATAGIMKKGDQR